MNLAAIAQQLDGAHRDKQGWRARCPVHKGNTNTSLHLWEESGQLRVHCFAGCVQKDILNALSLEAPKKQSAAESVFSYHNCDGNLIYQVVKWGPGKYSQRQVHPSKPGQFINNMEGVVRVLYRLPEVMQAIDIQHPVYIVEGEKDVETLRSHGLVGTCNPGGAGKWEDQYSESLSGADVILLWDNDNPGRNHRDLVTTRLSGYVRSLRQCDLPGLPEKGDVSDWLQTHSLDDLQKLVEPISPQITAPHLVMRPLSDIEREVVSWLWDPYLPKGKITFLEGDPGNGKTFLALAVATAISKGWSLPDQSGRISDHIHDAGNVLIITDEDAGGDTIRPRAEDMGADLSRIFLVEGWTAGKEVEPFSLANASLLEEAIRDQAIHMVLIDPIDAFLGANVDMYRPNEVRQLMSPLRRVAQSTDCSLLFIRHWTKASGGNSKYRGLGSIAFSAAARSILVVGEALDDPAIRIMAHSKINTGPEGYSQAFSLKDGIFGWHGISEIDAETLAQAQPRKRQHQSKAAFDWLRDFLKTGPISAQTIFDTASSMGISEATLKRVKSQMGILSDRVGGTWFWRLPRSTDDEIPF